MKLNDTEYNNEPFNYILKYYLYAVVPKRYYN
uniref:Uncharacterized protein n=1 Tax=Anguilla anguilla TaxID=7936 RepID=A0A0E9U7H6_ANGAN